MKRSLLAFAAFAILLAAVFLTARGIRSNIPEGSGAIVKIGFNLPLSGDVAEFGQIMKGSAELAKEDLEGRNLKYR